MQRVLVKLVSLEMVSLVPISTSATMQRPIAMIKRFALTPMVVSPAFAIRVITVTVSPVLISMNAQMQRLPAMKTPPVPIRTEGFSVLVIAVTLVTVLLARCSIFAAIHHAM